MEEDPSMQQESMETERGPRRFVGRGAAGPRPRPERGQPPPQELHIEGVEPDGDLEAGFRRAAEQRREFVKRFDQLPVIKHLRELWEAKGISSDDPVFLMVETFGLNDEHQTAKFNKIVKVLESSDRFNLDVVREIQRRVVEFEEMEHASAELTEHLEATRQVCNEMNTILAQFVQVIPRVEESVEDARKVLDTHTWRGFGLNLLSPVLGMFLGLAIGMMLWR